LIPAHSGLLNVCVFFSLVDEIVIYKDACLPIHHYQRDRGDYLTDPKGIGDTSAGGAKSG
jgi:hypothetical protein